MAENKQKVLSALLIALRPLARLLIRAGIGFREFSEISKTAFVEVATSDYGLRGRPTNISRVAVMTGLTRKEVRRLRDKSVAGDAISVGKTTPMAEIMHRWYTVPEYLDSDKRHPITLSFEGKTSSFSELVKRYGGDIPPGAMRTELKRVGAIEIGPAGEIIPKKRYITGADLEEKLVIALSMSIYPSILTADHNCNPANEGRTWIQRQAASAQIKLVDRDKIRTVSKEKLINFVESIDDIFAAYETINRSDIADGDRAVGIGVYYFEEDKSETDVFG